MRNLLSFILTVIFSVCFSQQYEPLTFKEIKLIQTDSAQMMRVSKLNNAEDSILLNTESKTIDPNDILTKLLAQRMLLSVQDEGGVGIAAPQVGINRRMILVQRFDKPGTPFEVMVNPEILWASELMQKGPEGDLSFEERGLVMRHYVVQIQYYNLNGELKTEILEGFTSVIFQHERDHLDGILLTEKIEEQTHLEFKPAVENANLYFNE